MTEHATRAALVFLAWHLLLVVPSAGAQLEGSVPALPGSERPTFRSGVELVTLNVTVTDERRRFVDNLGPNDFAVYDDGVRQELAFCGAASVPVDVAILLDLSSSMTGIAELVEQAALGFVRTLRADDRGMVIGFAGRPQVLQPLTHARVYLESAVRGLQMGGETALYDAVYLTLQEFARERKRSSAPRRQALVVLSDGDDTASLIDGDEALVAARPSGVTIYAIRLATLTSPTQPALVRNRFTSKADFMLRRLAQDSGGRVFTPKAPKHLADVYADIAAELSAQYLLAYVPALRPGDDRSGGISVRVPSRPEVTVRTRRGY